MYSVVLAAMITTGAGSTTGWCHGACHGWGRGVGYCHGSWASSMGCYGCSGCWGGHCHGRGGYGYGGGGGYAGYGGGGYGSGSFCNGCVGCYGCAGFYSSIGVGGYGCCGGCSGGYGSSGCYGCCGGAVTYGGCYGCCGGAVNMAPSSVPSAPERIPSPATPVPPAPPAAGGTVAPQTQLDEARPQSARITVKLPTNARLWVDDVNCPLTSNERSFKTPALVSGQQYFYTLRMEVTRDGDTTTENRRVFIAAGQQVTVDFNQPATVTAQR